MLRKSVGVNVFTEAVFSDVAQMPKCPSNVIQKGWTTWAIQLEIKKYSLNDSEPF